MIGAPTLALHFCVHGRRAWLPLLRYVRHGGFREQQNASHGHGILKRDAHDLGRIDDAGFYQIDILFARGIETDIAGNSSILLTTTPPSTAELSAIWRAGASSARLRI